MFIEYNHPCFQQLWCKFCCLVFAALGTFCDVVFNERVFETGMIILDKNRLCINKMFTKY